MRVGVLSCLLPSVLLAVASCQAFFGEDDYTSEPDGGTGEPDAATGGGGASPSSSASASASSVSSAGSAGAGGMGGGCGQPIGAGGAQPGQCPGLGMIPVDFPNTDTFCIDRTEVSREAYANWLATCPDTAGQPAKCVWNTSFAPTLGQFDCDPAVHGLDKDPMKPVVCVDWCDALAYCKAVGKRLCGKHGGGQNAFGDYADVDQSEWFAACTDHGQHPFPYGDVYDPKACIGDDYDGISGDGALDEAGPVGTATCKVGALALFDMSGNVWEWENSCEADVGKDDQCRDRGGSFWDEPGALPCDVSSPTNHTRGHFNKNVGIRCCADLTPSAM